MSKDYEESTASQVPVIAEGLTLGVVGAGVMGRTLIRGVLNSGLIARERIWAADKNATTCESASRELGIPVVYDFAEHASTADLILVCVKPADAPVALTMLRDAGLRSEALVISIMAGVSTGRVEFLLGTGNPVVRAMPNTPCVVGEGMTVICRGSRASKDHLNRARHIFEAVGRCIPVDETHFNGITALSASGPAYQFLIMEALAEAGVKVGLPRQLALTLVAQTTLGAARMLLTSGRHPAALRDDVTTPAGCTIGGLLMLEDGRIRSVLARAVEEAARIAGQLGAAPAKTA
ncbi:MAG: pyrroline-5-carboxylate reductase [Acidobacteriales bacterium]|nr:pyrroline-5-carboxylate reductase [Terriglobales bacterium]